MKKIVFYQNWSNPDGSQQRKIGTLHPSGQFTGEKRLEEDVLLSAKIHNLDLTVQEDRTTILKLYSGTYVIAVEE